MSARASLLVLVLSVLAGTLAAPGFAAPPPFAGKTASVTASVFVHTWGTDTTAKVMLKTGQTRTFTTKELQTGDSVGCVNTFDFGVTETVPRFIPHLPARIAQMFGISSAWKLGKGKVTVRLRRPDSRTLIVSCY